MDDTVTGVCPKCNTSVDYPTQFSGHETACPECGAKITIGRQLPVAPPTSSTPQAPPATPSAPPATPSAPPIAPTASYFKIVPFQADLKQQDNLDIAGQQLESALNHYSELGYDYVRMEQLSINVKPGCLGAFFGSSTTTILFDFIVFRKRVH